MTARSRSHRAVDTFAVTAAQVSCDGGLEPLFGGHIGARFTGASGWGTTIGLQDLRTSPNGEDLGTGALPRSLTHESFTFLVGVHRLLGRRR